MAQNLSPVDRNRFLLDQIEQERNGYIDRKEQGIFFSANPKYLRSYFIKSQARTALSKNQTGFSSSYHIGEPQPEREAESERCAAGSEKKLGRCETQNLGDDGAAVLRWKRCHPHRRLGLGKQGAGCLSPTGLSGSNMKKEETEE